MERRIDRIQSWLGDEERLKDEICPNCYHLMSPYLSEGKVKLYCTNDMCRNDEPYPVREVDIL